MPIDHKRKMIFIHIPRTGGTSIEKVLKIYKVGFFGNNKIQCPFCGQRRGTQQNVPGRCAQHIVAPEAAYHFSESFLTYFKFAFVRNPYTRARSVYRRRMRKPKLRQRYPTLTKFIKDFIVPIRDAPRNLDDYSHVRDQADYIFDANSQLKVDFVGRFENFKEDWAKICKINGWGEIKLRRANRGKRGGDTRYDDEAQALILDIYKRDFELLNYPTNLPKSLPRVVNRVAKKP